MKAVFDECEEVNEVVMVVDQTLLKQVVLKKRKADWCMLEIVVFEDREWHLKTALILEIGRASCRERVCSVV